LRLSVAEIERIFPEGRAKDTSVAKERKARNAVETPATSIANEIRGEPLEVENAAAKGDLQSLKVSLKVKVIASHHNKRREEDSVINETPGGLLFGRQFEGGGNLSRSRIR